MRDFGKLRSRERASVEISIRISLGVVIIVEVFDDALVKFFQEVQLFLESHCKTVIFSDNSTSFFQVKLLQFGNLPNRAIVSSDNILIKDHIVLKVGAFGSAAVDIRFKDDISNESAEMLLVEHSELRAKGKRDESG